MSGRIFRTAGFLTTFTFMTMLATGALHAATPAPVEIKVRVSEKGFSNEKGLVYTAARPLKLPQGVPVTITFIFSEEMSSLAVGDTHQIALRSDTGAIGETEKLWIMNKQVNLSFTPGDKGQLQYRAYCILDCTGMEHLTNLIIQVVKT